MAAKLLLPALIGASLISATPHPPPSHPEVPSGSCTDHTIDVPITSSNYQYQPPRFNDNFDIVDYLFNTSRKDSQQVFHPFGVDANKTTVTKKYTIAATFCTPKRKKGGKEKTVLLATSGLAYDGRYWAPSYKVEEYSFVERAMKEGYSVFYYDRIGTGKSTKESGYIAQASQAIALITELSKRLKRGTYTSPIGKPTKLVLVGHSFGSYTSNAAIAADPSLADAVILTGLSYPNPEKDAAVSGVGWGPTAFRAKIANTVDPKKWPKAEYDNGYIVFADIYGHIDTFFRTYERDVAEYADSIVAPLAVSEHASLGFLDLHAPSYRGKVFLTSGENDILGCGGDCKSTFAMGLQGEVWKGVSRFEYYVHPGAGHGVNFNKGAGVFFGKIFGFLDREV